MASVKEKMMSMICSRVLTTALIFVLWAAVEVESQGTPSMPTILSSSSSATTVNLTWTQASGDSVISFTISHTFDVIGCAGVGGSNTETITAESARASDSTYEYILTRLEENSRVVVTITATNSAGTGPGATVTRDTLEANPATTPASLTLTSATVTTLSVSWARVTCIDRNSDITDYNIRVIDQSGTSSTFGTRVPADPREYTATGLFPSTSYSIAVAALSIDLSVLPSTFLFGPEITETMTTAAPAELGFFHDGVLIANNSVISSIHEDGLLCLSTNSGCCEDEATTADWFSPGSSTPVPPVGAATNSEQVEVMRRPGAVSLKVKAFSTARSGVYTCRVPDANGSVRTLYAGVGLSDPLVITDLSFPTPTTLVCTSTGRPFDAVVWLINGVVIDFATSTIFSSSQVLSNAGQAMYVNTLTAQQASDFTGTFTCQLDGSVSRTLIVNNVAITSGEFVVGSRGTAVCTSSADPASISAITWRNSMGEVFVSSSESTNRLELVFDPVSDDLDGETFTCSVSIGGEVANQSFQVTPIAPSNLLNVTTSTSGPPTAGSVFRLICTVREAILGLSQTPSAQWLNIDMEVVSNSSDVTVSVSRDGNSSMAVLTFMSLQLMQSSSYTCVGTLMSLNMLSTEQQQHILNVQIPAPSVTVTSSGQHILGEGVNLTCTAETIPEVQSASGIEGDFVWLSNGEEIANDNVDSRFQLIHQVQLLMSHLRITSLSIMDRNFTCSASIQQRTFGRVSTRASAALLPNFRLSPPAVEITSLPADSNYFAGLELNLTCRATISLIQSLTPTVTIVWRINGVPIVNGDRIMVEETVLISGGIYERTLHFQPLKISHEGIYTCSADVSVSNEEFTDNATSEVLQEEIAIERECIQLRIKTGRDCTANFNMVVASNPFQQYLVYADHICNGCGVTNNTILEYNYSCFPNNPKAITFYGKVQSTSRNTSADIVRVLETLVRSEGNLLDSSAPVSIQTSSNGSCVPVDDTITTTEIVSTLSTQTEEETTGTSGGTSELNSVCCTFIFTLVLLALLSVQ